MFSKHRFRNPNRSLKKAIYITLQFFFVDCLY